ncbi:UDP-glucose flavonoid 3-O-glucosyltransferase 7-like [Cajanus cajan]|uniref:UDP-glucose flavonoid 3-O-glucosyltransferase 7-like n=1 Tax=Cajanus cajan TaxID=3821 RepID=UPI0010FB56CD|nr:UDP-glucose flavonoid 3-O-glucosyltransferase 7-like [Cajanus cajan]
MLSSSLFTFHSNTKVAMETPTPRALKIYFLPFFAQGHLIPLVQLARLVASRAQHVTIITTPSNAQLFHKTLNDAAAAAHRVRVLLIDFPASQVGLPTGVENLVAASDNDTAYKISMAAHLIKPQVESLMKQSPPDVFIPDIMFTWSKHSSTALNIPRLVFSPISIFGVCMFHAIKENPQAFHSHSRPYHIPALPHALTLPIKPSPGFLAITQSLLDGEEGSHGVIVNSFAELDVEYTKHYENLTGRKVWHIGPSSLMVQKTVPSVKGDEHECLTWLNSKENDSVVYICFGSLSLISDKQLYEIAIGLEASGHQFLWVVHRKNKDKGNEEEETWLPEGFKERMREKKRGMLIKGWAPQPLILNHGAVGGFVTHCGWNSVAEAISAGVPMITMPGFGDHYYTEKLITEVHGFGVEVGAAEWTLSPYEGKKSVVSGERIEKAVRRLMDGGEGEGIRKKAKEMKYKAWKAVNEGGSSHNSLLDLVQHLKSFVPNLEKVANN